MRLLHIVEPAVWARAQLDGDYRPASLTSEGFVHFSFPHQVVGVANARYRDRAELCVVEIDPARVPCEIRVEDSYGSGTRFPHVYGPIAPSAAIAAHALVRDASGDWTFNPDGRADAASTGH